MSISICVIYVTEFAMRKLKLELYTKFCQYDMLKNTEIDKKYTTKGFKKLFVLLQ